MSNWIDVKNKLPNDMEDVIIFTDGGIWVGYFDAERLEFCIKRPTKNLEVPEWPTCKSRIRHWHPLPEPPQTNEP